MMYGSFLLDPLESLDLSLYLSNPIVLIELKKVFLQSDIQTFYFNISLNQTIELQWNTLINNIRKKGTFSKTLAICDVSKSMHGIPIEVCISMGITVTQCCELDLFSNKMVVFNDSARLVHVQGNSLYEKINKLRNITHGYDSNIHKVIDMILNTAKIYNITKDNMLDKLIVFTNMQFEKKYGETLGTLMNLVKTKFLKSGYRVPQIIFWNLKTTPTSTPIKAYDMDVALLSGFSENLLETVLDNKIVNPTLVFKKNIEKYKPKYVPNKNDKFSIVQLNGIFYRLKHTF